MIKQINTLLKDYTWLLNLFIITAAIYLSLDTASVYLQQKLDIGHTPIDIIKKKDAVIEENNGIEFYSIIDKRNIFGLVPVSINSNNTLVNNPMEQAAAPIEAVAPTLNLKLIGTVEWNDENSRAIILNQTNNVEDLYKKGDEIEGAKIVEIERNKVTLDYMGSPLTLFAFDDKVTESVIPASVKSGNRVSLNSTNGPIKSVGNNQWEVPKDEITKALGNMNTLMNQAMLRPYYEDGKPSGFKVDRIRRDSMVEQIGLKNGDVIKNINGINISSTEDAFEVYKKIKNEPELKLQIKRQGKLESFLYNIK